MITEGEFKTLALWRAANHGTPGQPRFLPVGVSGVYNWRGTIGKTVGPDGSRMDVKGAIPDLDWLVWAGRRVVIAYDADAVTKEPSASPAQCSRRICADAVPSSASWNGTSPRVKESMTISPLWARIWSSTRSRMSTSRARHGRRTCCVPNQP